MTRSFHIFGPVTLKWLGLSFRNNYGITIISKHRVSINMASISVLTNGKIFVSRPEVRSLKSLTFRFMLNLAN